MIALDCFRTGAVFDGLCRWYGRDKLNEKKLESLPEYVTITEYDESKAKFKKNMRKLAKTLAEAGF